MKRFLSISLLVAIFLLSSCGTGRLTKLKNYQTLREAPLDPFATRGLMPSTGDVRVPVFLIDFPDFPADQRDTISRHQIDRAFNGHAAETGWESLSSFYEKSSFGKLKIIADVFDWYHSPEFSDEYFSEGTTYPLLNAVINHYAPTTDFSIYDSDGDGYVDSAYFIYSRPYASNTNFWAYKTSMAPITKNGVSFHTYVWMSRAFFDPLVTNSGLNGVDCETLVHESGHLMGLMDYYDTDYGEEEPFGGLGGPVMMDYGIGDHDPHSKMLLGWLEPLVLNTKSKGRTKIRLYPTDTGDVLMIAPALKKNYAIFDEYILIEFFRPTGLNSTVTDYFPRPAIRMFHVDASIALMSSSSGQDYYYFSRNNSNTTFKYIKFIENGGVSRIEELNPSTPGFGYSADETTLFYEGDDFGITQWEDYYMYSFDFNEFFFTMKVDKISDDKYADITIDIVSVAKPISSRE